MSPAGPIASVPPSDALYEDAACGLLITDGDGRIRRANRTFCSWIGRTPQELVNQSRLQDLLTMGGRIFHQTHWAPLLRMQGSVAEVKLEIIHKDGARLPMVMNAIRREHEGTTFHEIAVFSAKDRHQYEHELLAARQRAEKLLEHERMAQRFAELMMGIVSHDLRNPLWAIQAGAHLLERGELSEAQRAVVARINRSASRANRLIADLLDFTQARLGAGIKLALAEVSLHKVVEDGIEDLRLTFPERTILHSVEGEGVCQADADRLAQLLGNLVGNAMAYGAADAPVRVSSRVQAERCELSVHNEGPPIPQALVPHLFEPMTRGEAESSTVRSVGLGLFIVREIAKAHGGDVSVRSSQRDGTCFTVSFPRFAPRPDR